MGFYVFQLLMHVVILFSGYMNVSTHPANDTTLRHTGTKRRTRLLRCEDLWNEISQCNTTQWSWGWLWFLERTSRTRDASLMFCNHDLLFRLPDNEGCDPCNLYVSQLLKKKQQTPGNSPEGYFRHLTMMTVNVLSLFAGTDEKVGSGNYVSARPHGWKSSACAGK